MKRYRLLFLLLVLVALGTYQTAAGRTPSPEKEAKNFSQTAGKEAFCKADALSEPENPTLGKVTSGPVDSGLEKPPVPDEEEEAELAILRRFLEQAKDPTSCAGPLIEYFLEKQKRRERIRSPKALPLLLEIAETWFYRVQSDTPLRSSDYCFEAAYYLPGGRERLLEYVRRYRQWRPLAEAAIRVLARSGDPKILQQIMEWTQIKPEDFGRGDPPDIKDRHIKYAVEDFWIVCEQAKQFQLESDVRKRIEIVLNGLFYPGQGCKWADEKLTELSEQYPKEVAEAWFKKDRAAEDLPELRKKIEEGKAESYLEHMRHMRRKYAELLFHPAALKEYTKLEEEDRKRREAQKPKTPPSARRNARPLTPDPQGKLRAMGHGFTTPEVIDLFVARYLEKNPDIPLRYDPCDCDQVPVRLAGGKCEIGLLRELMAAYTWYMIEPCFPIYRVGVFAVAVLINSRNPTKHLTFEQLRKIFSGEVKNWEDLGVKGIRGRIELFSEFCVDIPGSILERHVLRGKEFDQELASYKTRRQKLRVEEVIESIANHPGGIGFCLDTPDLEPITEKRVRIIGICEKPDTPPCFPTPETIADKSYPILDTFTVVLHPDAPQEAHKFAQFFLSEEGAKLVKRYGLWPEYELAKVRGKARLKSS